MKAVSTQSDHPDRVRARRGQWVACLLSAAVLACGGLLGVSAAWAAGTGTTSTTTSTETSTTTSTETSTTTSTATSTTTNHTTSTKTKTKTVTSTPTHTTNHSSGKSSDIPWWVWVLIGFLVFGLLAAVWAVGRRQGRDEAVAYRDERYGPPYYEDEEYPPRRPPRAPPPPPME